MENIARLTHAYKTAHWRIQRQWVGLALLVAAAALMVAALYLDVTSQAAIAGREIQDLNLALTISEQNSADLQTQLAALTSSVIMRQRALALGFRPAEPLEMEYLIVPGYFVIEPPILSAPSRPQLSALTILPAYTQSLLDWLDEKIMSSARGWQ